MNDEIPNRVRRYAVYLLIIIGWAVFLVLATEFFRAAAVTRRYFGI